MKIKVSEATPRQLDWLVATCEGYTDLRRNPHRFNDELIMTPPRAAHGPIWFVDLAYSTDWSQGGPIIDQAFISVFELPAGLDISEHPTFKPGDLWEAEICPSGEDSIRYCAPSPLIAAMRCYVASKLGDEVEIPEELE